MSILRRPLPVLVLALCAGSFVPSARAGDSGPVAPVAGPKENASYVPDDDERLRGERAAVDAAVAAKDWGTAVRGLQRIVEMGPELVTATGEPGVFEGASIVASHRVVRLGAASLAAYEQELGGAANELLAAGATLRDPTRLARAAERYLPTVAGRRAALLLADLALEAGDVDGALGALERLEDLEEVAAPDLAAAFAPWREARLARVAVARARTAAALPRVRAWLEAPTKAPRPADDDLRRPPPSKDWPTAGGDATRGRVPEALGSKLTFTSIEHLRATSAPGDDAREVGGAIGARPSPWLPPRAVVVGGRAIVSDGRALRVFDVASGTYASFEIPLPSRPPDDGAAGLEGRAARSRFGWIEGHGLTVDGDAVYATVSGERADPDATDGPLVHEGRPGAPARRGDVVAAIRLSGRTGKTLWVAGGAVPTPGLPPGLRLHGTPLLYRGSLHLAGLRTTPATQDRFEAWHVALDPRTGACRSATFLGAGGPIRRGRDDELVPASCAGAHGRVLVVTALGVAAAVDADTGRTLWSWRYDRGNPDGDDPGHRLGIDFEQGARHSSFVNEPPMIADGRCFLAPTDATHVFAIEDRPRGPRRELRTWRLHRKLVSQNLAVEQLVGVTTGTADVPATLVAVGQGFAAPGEPFVCVVGLDPATGTVRWERALPGGGPAEPYGRALVTAGEVYVPTATGIARYRLKDGADLPLLDLPSIPTDLRDLLRPEERPFGNLVPIPGRGLVAVNATSISFWRVP